MNSLQIDYFIALVENMNFTRTAEKLFVSQPAISKQIAALENDLNIRLFDRTNKQIKLTPAGELIYQCFLRARVDLKNTLKEATKIYEGKTGNINISCLEGWDMSKYFSYVTQTFNQHFPGISIQISSRGFKGLVDSLEDETSDIIISIADSLSMLKSSKLFKIAEINRILTYSTHHVLALKPNLQINDFREETFYVVSDRKSNFTNNMVIEMCEPFGFVPKVVSVPNIESMMLQVESGLGVAIFDDWHRVKYNPELRFLDTESHHTVSAAWKKENSNPTINLFINEISLIINKNKLL
ncbi:LysR family transcriptional regulator [Alkalibaculum sp. M08DMB]|uniref:LysR family transcriptional regulator n=1 Tax=Alkalibaculum sporogenes TaxID=2655001 RepID=A0A6A7K5P4_9FIRM|nr:LysR family transcriptional regulator [Alkalibaculum sporogenes]MPW24738.1 LysR family transcriptional regulator [Alkalibaculum sporogenes]